MNDAFDFSVPAPAVRLRALLAENAVIRYLERVRDREFPSIHWSVFGAPATNELFVCVSNGRTDFVEAIESPLLYPPMADRIFGIDVADLRAAEELSGRMWTKYQHALL